MGLKIRKGDRVIVISGDYRGKDGEVLSCMPKKEMAIVQGVNMVKKHMKPRGQQQPGGIIEKEMPIHLSKLMLVDVTDKARTATRYTNDINESGKKIRRSKATGNEI